MYSNTEFETYISIADEDDETEVPVIVVAGGFLHEFHGDYVIDELLIESVYSEYLNRKISWNEIDKSDKNRLKELANERLLLQEVVNYEI